MGQEILPTNFVKIPTNCKKVGSVHTPLILIYIFLNSFDPVVTVSRLEFASLIASKSSENNTVLIELKENGYHYVLTGRFQSDLIEIKFSKYC